MNTETKIAVIIPVYSAEKILDELCSRLTFNLSQITDSFEIILVDDDSTDDSVLVIQKVLDKILDTKTQIIQNQRKSSYCGGFY